MRMQAGLWIDHRKAVIVTLSDEGEATSLVESNLERHVRYSGSAQSGRSHESRPGAEKGTQGLTPSHVKSRYSRRMGTEDPTADGPIDRRGRLPGGLR